MQLAKLSVREFSRLLVYDVAGADELGLPEADGQ